MLRVWSHHLENTDKVANTVFLVLGDTFGNPCDVADFLGLLV